MGFLLRWVLAFALLASTFNPTPYNYIHWAQMGGNGKMSIVVLSGLVLFVCYVIYLRATLRSIGPLGVALICAIFGAVIWVLSDFGFLALNNATSNTWLIILALSLVLGIGMSWSFVRRAISGQADVDDVDE